MALIGPAYHEYRNELLDIIQEKGKVWSSWTYYHPYENEMELREQLNKDKFFYIYVLDTEDPSAARRRSGATSGSGLVDYRLKVIKFDYEHRKRRSPDPNLSIDGIACEKNEKSCGWYLVDKIEAVGSLPWALSLTMKLGNP